MDQIFAKVSYGLVFGLTAPKYYSFAFGNSIFASDMAILSKQPVQFRDLGNMEYAAAWKYQEALLQENLAAKSTTLLHQSSGGQASNGILVPDSGLPTQDSRLTTHHLLFVEHPPVYTLGKSGNPENILITEAERNKRSIGFYKTNRGGDITFHGHEQLVGYPILDLERFYTDIGRYLRNIEEVIILTMADYGLAGERSPGETGVWLDPFIPGRERKICAIGVRCSRWITMHGFAFNVNTDLSYFDHIIPCGIQQKQVTSLQKELGRTLDMHEVKQQVKRHFERVFEVELV
jgi:lipoyl(octanoyl) transferase